MEGARSKSTAPEGATWHDLLYSNRTIENGCEWIDSTRTSMDGARSKSTAPEGATWSFVSRAGMGRTTPFLASRVSGSVTPSIDRTHLPEPCVHSKVVREERGEGGKGKRGLSGCLGVCQSSHGCLKTIDVSLIVV
jgi:hypothetical protein